MYHDGELEVQKRAGVVALAAQVGRSIRNFIPPSAMSFLAMQKLAVAASVAGDGHVWASALVGERGFLSAPDPQRLRIGIAPRAGDPLWTNLENHAAIGVLILDPATRRRMRVNGRAQATDREILVQTEQVYSNCPKYIQQRAPEEFNREAEERRVVRSAQLSFLQQEFIARGDTFFLATAHSVNGADASHRGGMPGFARVLEPGKLLWPDYPGNNMFQSLGNLKINPRAGLLFMDFARGSTLQLSGKAQVIWNSERMAEFPGAQRLIEFTVSEVLESEAAFDARWRLLEYSPVNPR